VLVKRNRIAVIRAVAVVCALVLVAPRGAILSAQQPPSYPPPAQTLTPDQVDDLVAPIALYPDPLLSQILVAATYPLEIVQADQWLQHNPGLTGPALTQAVQQQNWDPSVQALVMFPDLIKRLSQDITWTTNLGNVFLAQQPDVMDAIQRMRFKANQAGKLPSTSQQRVTTTTESGQPVIYIEPANPQVIYVPQYNPVYIWGPPIYYPYAQWYYPPVVTGVFLGFGVGITIGAFFGGGWGGWGGWGWRPGWSSHTVIVNNNFIHRHNFNSNHLTTLHGNTVWTHDAVHRQAVPYPNHALADHYGAGVRQNLRPREMPGQPHGGPGGGGQVRGGSEAPAAALPHERPGQVGGGSGSGRQVHGGSEAPAAGLPHEKPGQVGGSPGSGGEVRRGSAPAAAPSERMGNRQIAPSAPSRAAFSGSEQGGMARMHSDHGFSSLGPARGAPPAPAPRSSGGGGGQRGGGGGQRGGGGGQSGAGGDRKR